MTQQLWETLYKAQVSAEKAQKAFDRADNKYSAGDLRLVKAAEKLGAARKAESDALQAAVNAI